MMWSPQEDEDLRALVGQYGPKRWSMIARALKTKGSKQCRRRWNNYLNADLKRGGWDPQEDAVLLAGHMRFGNKWTEIARLIGGRTDNAVKNRFASLTKRSLQLSPAIMAAAEEIVSQAAVLQAAESDDADDSDEDELDGFKQTSSTMGGASNAPKPGCELAGPRPMGSPAGVKPPGAAQSHPNPNVPTLFLANKHQHQNGSTSPGQMQGSTHSNSNGRAYLVQQQQYMQPGTFATSQPHGLMPSSSSGVLLEQSVQAPFHPVTCGPGWTAGSLKLSPTTQASVARPAMGTLQLGQPKRSAAGLNLAFQTSKEPVKSDVNLQPSLMSQGAPIYRGLTPSPVLSQPMQLQANLKSNGLGLDLTRNNTSVAVQSGLGGPFQTPASGSMQSGQLVSMLQPVQNLGQRLLVQQAPQMGMTGSPPAAIMSRHPPLQYQQQQLQMSHQQQQQSQQQMRPQQHHHHQAQLHQQQQQQQQGYPQQQQLYPQHQQVQQQQQAYPPQQEQMHYMHVHQHQQQQQPVRVVHVVQHTSQSAPQYPQQYQSPSPHLPSQGAPQYQHHPEQVKHRQQHGEVEMLIQEQELLQQQQQLALEQAAQLEEERQLLMKQAQERQLRQQQIQEKQAHIQRQLEELSSHRRQLEHQQQSIQDRCQEQIQNQHQQLQHQLQHQQHPDHMDYQHSHLQQQKQKQHNQHQHQTLPPRQPTEPSSSGQPTKPPQRETPLPKAAQEESQQTSCMKEEDIASRDPIISPADMSLSRLLASSHSSTPLSCRPQYLCTSLQDALVKAQQEEMSNKRVKLSAGDAGSAPSSNAEGNEANICKEEDQDMNGTYPIQKYEGQQTCNDIAAPSPLKLGTLDRLRTQEAAAMQDGVSGSTSTSKMPSPDGTADAPSSGPPPQLVISKNELAAGQGNQTAAGGEKKSPGLAGKRRGGLSVAIPDNKTGVSQPQALAVRASDKNTQMAICVSKDLLTPSELQLAREMNEMNLPFQISIEEDAPLSTSRRATMLAIAQLTSPGLNPAAGLMSPQGAGLNEITGFSGLKSPRRISIPGSAFQALDPSRLPSAGFVAQARRLSAGGLGIAKRTTGESINAISKNWAAVAGSLPPPGPSAQYTGVQPPVMDSPMPAVLSKSHLQLLRKLFGNNQVPNGDDDAVLPFQLAPSILASPIPVGALGGGSTIIPISPGRRVSLGLISSPLMAMSPSWSMVANVRASYGGRDSEGIAGVSPHLAAWAEELQGLLELHEQQPM